MDLMGGKVVRAKRGERHAYRPIESQLCKTAEPVAVAEALLQLYPFASLYIADLDAIQGRAPHLQAVSTIRRALPGVELWIDAGIAEFEQCQPWLEIGAICVIGSESQHDVDSAISLLNRIGNTNAVLSLDYANAGLRGPGALFERAELWPERVIGMTLGRVGSYEGPDINTLQSLQQQGPGRRIYAAGGVRSFSDLQQLATMRLGGALIASVLHDGKVTADQLAQLAS